MPDRPTGSIIMNIAVDIDIECLKNLEPLLKGVECFVARESAKNVSNTIIRAVLNHPFLRDLIDSLIRSVHGAHLGARDRRLRARGGLLWGLVWRAKRHLSVGIIL